MSFNNIQNLPISFQKSTHKAMLYKENIWFQSRMTLISISRMHTVNIKIRKAIKNSNSSKKRSKNFKTMSKMSRDSLEKTMIRQNNLITRQIQHNNNLMIVNDMLYNIFLNLKIKSDKISIFVYKIQIDGIYVCFMDI